MHIWNILHQFCYFQDIGWFCRSATEKDIFTHRRANLIKNQAWIQNSAITFTAILLNLLCKFEKLANVSLSCLVPQPSAEVNKEGKYYLNIFLISSTLQDDYFSNHHSPRHHKSWGRHLIRLKNKTPFK